MSEAFIEDHDPRIKKQLSHAEELIHQNANYALSVCMGILQRNPGWIDVRKILRKAQLHAYKQKKNVFSQLGGRLNAAIISFKIPSLIKKDPLKALILAEKMITANPKNKKGYRYIGEAAEKLSYWHTAAFAYESWLELDSQNSNAITAVGNALMQAGRPLEAVAACDRVLIDNPANEAAQAMVRRASVAETMQRGKWEAQSDYREKLADVDQAVELEKKSRVVNDAKTLQELTRKEISKLDETPDDLNIYRTIISNFEKLGNFKAAIEYLKKARELPQGKMDATLEQLQTKLTLKKMQLNIELKNQELDEEPDNKQLQAEITELESEQCDFKLRSAQAYVEKYPNDHTARYELGELLLAGGQFDAAIKQFQQALKSPKVRVNAIFLLGRSYMLKQFYDLAIEQFLLARSELPVMDDLKKSVLYDLGLAYEKTGETGKAFETFKALYASDIDYLDVARRINAYYQNGKQDHSGSAG